MAIVLVTERESLYFTGLGYDRGKNTSSNEISLNEAGSIDFGQSNKGKYELIGTPAGEAHIKWVPDSGTGSVSSETFSLDPDEKFGIDKIMGPVEDRGGNRTLTTRYLKGV